MEQRDYFLKQIDQLGKALANVLSLLMQKGFNNSAMSNLEMIDKVLKENLHIDMQNLIDQKEESFIQYLLGELNISFNNLELLSETIKVFAESSDQNIKIYKKALIILEYVQKNSKDYSFDRQNKIMEIERKTH